MAKKRTEKDTPVANSTSDKDGAMNNAEPVDVAKLMSIGSNDEDGRQFVVPSADSKGKSVQVQFRAQPAHIRQGEIILQSRRFPWYRTLSDMLRHAWLKHIIWLEQQEPDANSVLWKLVAMDEVLKDQEIDATFDKTFAVMDETIRRHISSGDEARAQKLVRTMWGMIQSANDGDLKTSCCKRMQKQYGHLLPKKGEPLSFMDLDMDDEGE